MKLCMLAIFAVCVCVCVDYRHWFVSVYLPFFGDRYMDRFKECFYNILSMFL